MRQLPSWVGRVALFALGILAALKLATEFHRLTRSQLHIGAIDLVFRFEELHRWFAGLPIYSEVGRITYPPATYVLLWPFLGWLPVGQARWFWAITSILALAWVVRLIVRATGADSTGERLFVALMFLSMNAVGVTVGNGQLILHLLPALLTAILLLRRAKSSWATDAVIALLLTFSLIKPTVAAPFGWVILLFAGRLRPLVLTVTGYLAVTLLALWFQPGPPLEIIGQWLAQAQPARGGGYGDLQTGLVAVELSQWAMPVSLAVLIALGGWTWWRRAGDPWVLLGVAALVARLWAYHRGYDDVLTIVPMVALYRIIRRQRMEGRNWTEESVVLAAGILTMLEFARFESAAGPLHWFYVGSHVAVWIAMLVVLDRAGRSVGRAAAGTQAGSRPTPSASATRLM